MREKKRERSLLRYFFEGLIALLPLALTGLIIYWFGSAIHSLLNIFPEKVFELLFPDRQTSEIWVPIYWILFYLVIVVLFFFLTAGFGLIIRISLARKLFNLWEKLLSKIPLVRNLYDPLRQVFASLLASREDRFKRVVLIEYPRKGIFSLAFVTSELTAASERKAESADGDEKKLLTLFIPSSPNPTTGWMLIASEDQVWDAGLSVEQGVKIVFSGGLISQNMKKLHELVERIGKA